MPSNPFRAQPAPLQDYTTAVDRIHAMQTREAAIPGFNPGLKSILLTHDQKTKRAVLWFHGYTAASVQFKPLAELCYQQGYNVLVPCVPHHGMLDRMSAEVSKIKAVELVRFADEMVDLAHGLGDELIVGGLSMGGAMTAWAAQERADISIALIIAPFLGARIIPVNLTKLAALGLQIQPDKIEWWDEDKKENCDGGDYGYPRHSTHSLSQILQLGFKVFSSARKAPPAAKNIWMVINDHDESVNNEVIARLVNTWQKTGAHNVHTHHFPDELGIPHDCISIEQPKQNTGLVYAELMRMIG